MHLAWVASLSIAGLFLGMLLLSEIGRRIGLAAQARDPEGLNKGTGAAEAAVFGLLGLLLAFTFSGAASRFEARRHLITEEANAIGTAYLRVALLPADAQPGMREQFRHYLDLRVSTYRDSNDAAATQAKLDKAALLQTQIWNRAVAATRRPDSPPPTSILLFPALNDMFDITTTRVAATRNHPPMVIFLLLGALCLVSALLVGIGTSLNRVRIWLHPIIFASALSLTIYVIVDIEFPRLGLIRVDTADQVLVELRKSMQ